MRKGLLAWNIILTLLLFSAIGIGYLEYNRFNENTYEKIYTINEHLKEINKVMTKQTEVINRHTEIINEHAKLINEEYIVAIEANQHTLNEMVELITEYRDVINKNAAYFGELLEELESLSITLAQ